MSTPESLSDSSNSPPIASSAETILATAEALHAGDTGDTPTDDAAAAVEAPEAEETASQPEPEPKRKRNLSWTDAMKQVPPDIAKLMKQLQGDYTRKTQELASERKNFLREREALMKGAETLQERELPEYDPYNEDSIKARIENEVSRRLKEVLEPMQQEYQTMQAEDNYKSFLSNHPDFETDKGLRSEVQHLLESNASLDLETAYWAAKGKQSRMKAQADAEKRSAKRKADREAAMTGTGKSRKVAGGGAPARSTLKGMSNSDLLALAQSMHRNR